MTRLFHVTSFRQIQTRLVLYYGAFALLTAASIAYFAYIQAANALASSVQDKLVSIANIKQDSINQWVDEQQRSAIFLSSLPEIRALAGKMLSKEELTPIRHNAEDQLTNLAVLIVQRTSDFNDIEIIDLSGNIVVSAIKGNVGISQAHESYFIEGRTKTYVQNFYHSVLLGSPTLTVSTPLFDNNQKRVGVFVIHLNMKRVDRIMRENVMMNEPIQSYLFSSESLLLTDDPLLQNQTASRTSPAIKDALAGGHGAGSYTNHEGVRVIGAYLWVEEQKTALIVEVDYDSALKPARNLAMQTILFGIVASLGLLLIVFLLANRITRPLRALTETAVRIAGGELDAVAPILSEDEVGSLARAFNAMTASLRQSLDGLQNELRERHRVEQALRESEERFRKVFHASPVAICITALKDGRLLDANTAYWDITGYQPSDIGHTAKELNMWDIPNARHVFVANLQEKRSIYNMDDYLSHVDGSIKQVISFYELIQIADEECVLAMFYDVSAQKNLEREREALVLELESKNAELERFTYTVSHDLKSPLVTINGFLGYLERDAAAGNLDRLAQDTKRIREAVEKMRLLLNELLELSRIGRIINPPTDISFNEIVREAQEVVHGLLEERKIQVIVQPDMPTVHVDKPRMVEVMQNLLDNAAKYMGAQPAPRIEVGCHSSADQSPVFYVKDNGIGIDSKYHDSVFGLFNKLDATSEGTGVGLSIVKRVIEVHNGKIWVESILGQGSVFYFALGKNEEK